MIPWWKQKTTWTLILGVLTAWTGVLTGEIGWQTAIAATIAALSGIFLRQGVEKATFLVLGAALLTGCGLLSSGTSGAAGEVGAATATIQINVYDFGGAAGKVVADEDGNLTAVAQDSAVSTKDGDAAKSEGGIVINIGREAASAKTSSGGGSTGASQAGGSGDIAPTLPIPTRLAPVE